MPTPLMLPELFSGPVEGIGYGSASFLGNAGASARTEDDYSALLVGLYGDLDGLVRRAVLLRVSEKVAKGEFQA